MLAFFRTAVLNVLGWPYARPLAVTLWCAISPSQAHAQDASRTTVWYTVLARTPVYRAPSTEASSTWVIPRPAAVCVVRFDGAFAEIKRYGANQRVETGYVERYFVNSRPLTERMSRTWDQVCAPRTVDATMLVSRYGQSTSTNRVAETDLVIHSDSIHRAEPSELAESTGTQSSRMGEDVQQTLITSLSNVMQRLALAQEYFFADMQRYAVSLGELDKLFTVDAALTVELRDITSTGYSVRIIETTRRFQCSDRVSAGALSGSPTCGPIDP